MAQLPPRVPNVTPVNWHDFAVQKPPPAAAVGIAPSWVDEFLDFSSAKRGSHRRSISDSIAFLESPMAEECRRMSTPGAGGGGSGLNGNEFERFDDEQLLSMFNDDIAASIGPTSSNPSSPSDHNSINNDDVSKTTGGGSDILRRHQMPQQFKTEPEEVESSCKSEDQTGAAHDAADNSAEKIVDPKRIKRILANRQSAQRSRVRKLQYISELERSVTSLQAEVSVLSPRVAYLDHQRLVLNVDNSVLKQRIAALAQDKLFKDAHQDALKREIERLRQIYYQQNMKNAMEEENNNATQPPPANPSDHKIEQLAN